MEAGEPKHDFWVRFQAAIEEGQLAGSDICEWFNIPEATARLWRAADGPKGPFPPTAQQDNYRKLELLEEAIRDHRFPLVNVRARRRRYEVGKIFDELHGRVSQDGAAGQGTVLRRHL